MGETINIEDVKVSIGSHKGKTIVIGSDHGGFDYKKEVVKYLKEKGCSLIDVGTDSSERCDYPAISHKIGKMISEDPYEKVGISICRSGIGMLIPASKVQGVYGARCLTPKDAEMSRKHNNTNMLSIGADYVDINTALKIIDTWLNTNFYSDTENEKPYLNRFVQTVKLERG